MRRFVEWDSLEVRVDGERLSELAARFRVPPVERVSVTFANGVIRVEGSVRKIVSIPFTVEIAQVIPRGTSVALPVRSAAAFGGLPIPRFLFGLVREKLPQGLVQFEEPATFVVSLDRFLPGFVTADIQKIWIIDGGLAVTLGRGGADIPPQFIGGLP